jgi:hypothetical protein
MGISETSKSANLQEFLGKLNGKLTGLAEGLNDSHKLIKLVATFRILLFTLQAEIFCSSRH